MISLFPRDQVFGCIPPDLARTLSGFDVYTKMMAGEIPPPPIYRLLNFRVTECEQGRTVVQGRPGAEHYNPIGTVHGGWVGAIMDSALASCVHTMLPVGAGFSTAEFKVNIIRPLNAETGDVFCEGKVIHFGRTLATSEARLTTADGKLIAHGTETCAIFPAR